MKVSASKVPIDEGRLLGPGRHQLDPIVHEVLSHVACPLAQHVEGEVESDDPCTAPVGELDGHAGRTRGHVEDQPGSVGTTWSTMARRQRPFCPMERTSARRS